VCTGNYWPSPKLSRILRVGNIKKSSTIGYSFRDQNINKFLIQLLKDNKKLIVIDKKTEHNIRTHFIPVITEVLSNGDHSILVDIDGKMIQIEIISNYIEPANMDEIVKKISLLV
jgi:hypothetical protein